MISIGQIINGKFRILRLLGKGGMSSVYLAEDLRLSMYWAVKEIPKTIHGRDNSLYIQAALSEAYMIRDLSHPGIVRIVDIAEDPDALYVIEDYVSGVSLKSFLHGKKALSERTLLDWAVQVADILQYLHSRKPPVVYRDMKPENLILTESGHMKLIDFGIARRFDADKQRDTEYLGTERYAAPEQYEENGQQTDPRTDIYGFGMTFSYLLASCPEVSPQFQQVIRKCIQTDPARRYQSADALKADLQKLSGKRKWIGNGKRRYLRYVFPAIGLVLILAGRMLWQGEAGSTKGSRSQLEDLFHLTEQMEADQCFDREEEERLLQSLLPNLSELQAEEDFDQLAYQIGILYWYDYDYGYDHSAGRMASGEWFRMAKGTFEMAEAYESIASFLRQSKANENTEEDPQEMRRCFLQIAWLLEKIPQEDSKPWHFPAFCRFVKQTLPSWKESLLTDGVSLEEYESVLSLAETSLS